MIDKEILNTVLPVPDLMDLKNRRVERGWICNNKLSFRRSILHDTYDCASHKDRTYSACPDNLKQHVCFPCLRCVA